MVSRPAQLVLHVIGILLGKASKALSLSLAIVALRVYAETATKVLLVGHIGGQ